ncbi:MAG: TetR/AcrR family transcriptional regulator [Acidobacteriota bacterium]|nr:TetR/AcrR family transcriptional regulator [Acidobacteriota bacterium]
MVSHQNTPGEVHDRLLSAAQQVFARGGYAGGTVDDIIAAAGTSRATFYRYFRSKEHLFDELSRACFKEMRSITKELAADDPVVTDPERLEQLVAAFGAMQERQRGVIRAWLEKADRPGSSVRKEAAQTFNALLQGLEQRIQAVGTPSEVDAEVQAALLFILLTRSTFYVRHRHSRLNPDDLTPTLATMIQRAYLGGTLERRGRLRVAAGG